jgi:hypothetical protein
MKSGKPLNRERSDIDSGDSVPESPLITPFDIAFSPCQPFTFQ